MRRRATAFVAGLVLVGAVAAQSPDTVRTGRFDAGKMWAFEYAPAAYFTETYGFAADSAWFARARMAALRIPGCSAAFVSPQGLVATNHHCVRSRVTQVAKPGETLLDDGFFAGSLDAERSVAGLYADQLLGTRDVSDEVFAAVDRQTSDTARERARREAGAAIEARLRREFAGAGDSIVVQVVALYHGGRHSAYVFRRFTDVRLVAAAELQMGFFGGDEDNFVYPRYALDFAFLRVYGRDGRPYGTDHWFRWSREGVKAGDAVFVIGNPGPTSRLLSVAQLEFQRDVQVPAMLDVVTAGLSAMRAYRAARPEEAEAYDIRNRMFGLSNTEKQSIGRLAALRDEAVLGRKRVAERELRAAIAARPDLRRTHGDLFDRFAALQTEKRALAKEWRAFTQITSPASSPAVLRRALVAHGLRNAPADSGPALRARLLAIRDVPADLDRRLLAARLDLMVRALGPTDPLMRSVLGDRSPTEAAGAIVSGSALADSARTGAALGAGGPGGDDPALRLAAALAPRFDAFHAGVGAHRDRGARPREPPGAGPVRVVRAGHPAGRHLLAPRDRRGGALLRGRRHDRPAVHHVLRTVRPVQEPRIGHLLGPAAALAHAAGRTRPRHAAQFRVHGRHLRWQLGLAGDPARLEPRGLQLRPEHGRPVPGLHLSSRAGPQYHGRCAGDPRRARSCLRPGPRRPGAPHRPGVRHRGGSGRRAAVSVTFCRRGPGWR
jgi:hypothetical protein